MVYWCAHSLISYPRGKRRLIGIILLYAIIVCTILIHKGSKLTWPPWPSFAPLHRYSGCGSDRPACYARFCSWWGANATAIPSEMIFWRTSSFACLCPATRHTDNTEFRSPKKKRHENLFPGKRRLNPLAAVQHYLHQNPNPTPNKSKNAVDIGLG